jgi:hypothetical protein
VAVKEVWDFVVLTAFAAFAASEDTVSGSFEINFFGMRV